MSTKDFLRRHRGTLRVHELPSTTSLHQVAECIRERSDRRLSASERKFDKNRLQYVSVKVLNIALKNSWGDLNIEGITLREAIFSLEYPKEDGLAASTIAVSNLLEHIKRVGRKSLFRTIVRFFLRTFNPSSNLTNQIGVFISENVKELGSEIAIHAHRHFELFFPSSGPRMVAQSIVESLEALNDIGEIYQQIHSVFDTAGINHNARTFGFGEHSFRSACDIVRMRLSNTPRVEDVWLLTEWANIRNAQVRPNPGRSVPCPIVAESLLLPWKAKPNVPLEVKSAIRKYIKCFGDPRLFQDSRIASENKWWDVSDDAKQVYMRWLHLDTVTFFFDVVDKIVDADVGAIRQWKPRRQFWEEKINNNEIVDCSMAFAKAGQDLLRYNDSHHFDRLYRALRDHAVLLMEVRPNPDAPDETIVVADWNHKGSMRIWKAKNRAAPTVSYETHDGRYITRKISGDELRTEPDTDPIWHVGNWQGKARTAMRKLTAPKSPIVLSAFRNI